MKTNEIQIGDWVIPHIYDSILEPSKIVGIHYNSWKGSEYCDWVDCESWDELSLNDIEPIHLTAEILEKNGFRKRKWESNSYVNSESEAAYICFSIGDYTNFWGGGDQDYVWVTVKYVHQLQHALRLCGIEKEIEL